MNKVKKALITTIPAYDKLSNSFAVNVDLTIANALNASDQPTLFAPLKRKRLWHTLNNIWYMLLNRKKFDIIILPLFGTRNSILWYRIISAAGRLLGKRMIAIVRGGSIVDNIEKVNNPFISLLSRAEAIVTPSPFFKHVLGKLHLQCVVIENPIKIIRYPFKQKSLLRPRIIWMRTFHDIYNPQMAIEVAALLIRRFPDFKMVMAGADRGLLSACKVLAAEKGLNNCTDFPGYINLQQKNELAAEYDIYICTNKIDNAPFSFVEFMAMGLPIVSVATGGIPYLIKHEWNGLLCADNNPQQMTDAIVRLIENPKLAAQIRTNAYKYAHSYDEDTVAMKWKTLLHEIRNK